MNKLTLKKILKRLESSEENKQALGYEALSVISTILEENPFDVDTRIKRMRLNTDWVFSNTQEIIEDATFFIENEAFGKDKNVGYNWLSWVYDEVLVLPEKAIETIEEQLVEIHIQYKERHIKDNLEGELLNKIAGIKHDNNQKEEALKIWNKSFDKYPYLGARNAFVGMLFLENKDWEKATKFLLKHYDWSYQYEDGYRLKYGLKLKELYEKNELDNQPDLIGLLYNIIRNEKEYFKIEGKLEYYEQYYPKIEKWAKKYPKNSLILTAIAHTHYYDTKNYEKALESFTKMIESDRGIHFTSINRIHKAAKKSEKDFFELPFKMEGLSSDLYNAMTDISEYTDKTKKKKKRKKYAELAVKLGEVGYKQYREYFFEGKGKSLNNEPHMFAMLCNNYANALVRYAKLFTKKEEKNKLICYAGDIHIEGYEISPFIENLENASQDYFKGKDYKKAIKYSEKSIKDYKNELSIYDYQFHYWQIVRSYIKLEDLEKAAVYYTKAKELFQKVGKGSKDATHRFIFTSKLFYEFAINQKQEYQKNIPELEWFLEKEIALKQEPKEYGLVSYYLGICYKETKQKEKALKAFQKAVDYLQEAEWGFYDTKCDQAEDYIKELGGKVIKKIKEKKKKKSVIKRMLDTILFPFMIMALIGGIVFAAASGKYTGEKKNKG